MSRNTLALALAATAALALCTPISIELGGDDASYRHFTPLSSFEVRHQGIIELSPNGLALDRLAPDAYLAIEHRRLLTDRSLVVTAGSDGRPLYDYTVDGKPAGAAEAERFLRHTLPEVTRMTAVGAAAQAERLLASGGPDAVLREVRRLESDLARVAYFEALLASPELDGKVTARIATAVGRELSSSSRLRETLTRVAEQAPHSAGAELSRALFDAAAHIDSSSERAVALVELHRLRGAAGAVDELGRALAGISSSSDLAGAIRAIAGDASDPELLAALAGASRSIDSSSELTRALDGLADRPELEPSTAVAVLEAARGIGGSSEKSAFLVRWSRHFPVSRPTFDAYLDVADAVASSSDRAAALAALIERGDLPPDVFIAAVVSSRDIGSSSDAARFMAVAAAHLPPGDGPFSALLRSTDTVGGASDRAAALSALLEAPGLTPGQLEEIARTADELPPSQGGPVIERARKLLDEG